MTNAIGLPSRPLMIRTIAIAATLGLALAANAQLVDGGREAPACQGPGCHTARSSAGSKELGETGDRDSPTAKTSAAPGPRAKAERNRTPQPRHPQKPCEEIRPCPID